MSRIRRFLASDIPFARDDAHRLLPVMIACLSAFACLLLAVAVCVNHAVDARAKTVIGVLQIEVPRARAQDKSALNVIVEQIKHTPGVEQVNVIGEGQMEQLLKPWLGENFELADLPVPTILEVTTTVRNQKTVVNVDALRRTLASYDRGIRIEDRGPWVTQMAQATALLQALVIIVALLLLSCVIGMIVLVAKTNLRLHFKTVSLLHMFGATDEYILQQFQSNSAWLAARGAIAGVASAAFVFGVAVLLSRHWHSPILPEIDLTPAHAAIVVLLPIFTAVVAYVATRVTVRSMLHHMH